MGIKGLGAFIKWRLPRVRKSLQMAAHSGERWGVDSSCLLYRARGDGLSTLTVIASLLVRLRRANITPIFVFDGRTPVAKADTVDQRRVVRQAAHKEMAEIRTGLEATDLGIAEKGEMERRHAALQKKAPSVSGGDRDEVKRLLYAAGVQFVTASGEADDVLAHLCRSGFLQGVISTDMDMLARGVPLLVIPETSDATVLVTMELSEILTGLALNYRQFVGACVLMGSDYAGKDWVSVAPKEAIARALAGVDDPAVGLLCGEGVVWEEIVSEKQRAKWDAGVPAREPETLVALASANSWPRDWCTVLG
jgi:flap endonuclease-1